MAQNATRWNVRRYRMATLAGLLAMVVAPLSVGAQPCEVTPSEYWKNTIDFPDEPFRVVGGSADNPDWVKFTIMTCDPETVYYQDSNEYTFHYNFVTEQLDPYLGISPEDFNLIALYEQGQELMLGAVIMPASGIYPEPEQIPEYGIQLVRYDPYTPQEVVDLFNLVKSTVNADPGVQAFYFPTYEQYETAQDNIEFLNSNGIEVSSPARWADDNACYSSGWALGELKFFEGHEIEDAYLSGALLPEDILLTDGVPAEVPFVAGIMTLTSSTPNSHVAILANTWSIPFVHLALAEDAEQALALVGKMIVLRAYGTDGGCNTRLIDVDGVLSAETIAEILELKVPPPLDIAPMQAYGAYSANTDTMVLSDIQYFGGKAANFGFLRRAIPDNSPLACAFSFDLWNAFMDQTLTGGNTLREEIAGILSGYTYPPNMAQLADDLDDVRDLIKDDEETFFTQELQDAVIATLQDPQYGFDPYKKIRFRSSTNVEDSDQFTGAGLYDSYSGCLMDDLDGDEVGPSHCDPSKPSERGVFRAIRKVFASFYNDNAFLERLRYNVNEDEVGMAVLVHHSFPDEIELANGVSTLDKTSYSCDVLLVSQLGAVSVTNPEGGAIPEEVDVYVGSSSTYATILRYSSLVQLGDTVMDWDQDYIDLAEMMDVVSDDYATAIGETSFLLDFEYKKVAPGGGALPAGGLVIKQVRKIPQPDTTPSITPFLINEPVEYCTIQAEHGDVFANHRLKSRWWLATQSLWMTAENLETSFYTDAAVEYTDGCWPHFFEDQLSEFPGAWHTFDEELHTTVDGWQFSNMSNPRDYELQTPYVRTLVPPSESPLLTLIDLGWPYVTVEHAEPVPTWDWNGPTTTTSDTITIGPCPQPASGDLLQERVLVGSNGVTISTTFYWPAEPGGIMIYTAPLSHWVETVITGLTSEPIVLHDWYSQTYCPGHHNITEFFIFEPRLEPGLSQEILDELIAEEIQYIYVVAGSHPSSPVDMYYYDDVPCDSVVCVSNADCGFPGFGRYCEKAVGDCEGLGLCATMPLGCPDVWDPVCGCDGVTYGNACEAAAAGASIAYDGACVVGDIDLDEDIDLDDHAVFVLCMTGPGGGVLPDCAPADLDHDDDVDLGDFQVFQREFPPLSPYVSVYANSGCLPGIHDDIGDDPYSCPGDDTIELTVDGSTLHVVHRNATYNCCPDDIIVSLSVEGNVLTLTEEEILTAPCDCVCCYEVQATVADLSSGAYTVRFCWYDYETEQATCYEEGIVIP